MSIDLTAAFEAVCDELGIEPLGALSIEWWRDGGQDDHADSMAVGETGVLVMDVILAAALPRIEAAVREQIAGEIEALRDERIGGNALVNGRVAVGVAARIARGEVQS